MNWRVIFLGVATLLGCGVDDGDSTVNFYNWADYIHPDTLPGFEAETGIRVHHDVGDSNATLEAKLFVGSTGYDVVVSADTFLSRQRQAGLFQPIDESRLPNLGNLDPDILLRLAVADPGNRHAVPYAWGANGLGINIEKVAARLPNVPTDSWEILFNAQNAKRLADCGITLVDAADDVVEVALIYLGLGGSQELEHLHEAFEMLSKIRPYVRYFNSYQYIDDLANGEVCLSFGWPSDVFQAEALAKGSVVLDAVIPREGSLMWVDYLAIPADAPHLGNAYELIDYLLRPAVAASFTNDTFFASANKRAFPIVDPLIRSNPAVYPSKETLQRLTLAPERTPQYVRQRNRLWTDLKANLSH